MISILEKKQKEIFCNPFPLKISETKFCNVNHCVKSVRIRSFSGPYFPAFGLNTEIFSANLCIQYERGEVRTRKTPNTDTFYAMNPFQTNASTHFAFFYLLF